MLEMSMSPEMRMRVTPALLNLTQLLTLPSLDLQQLVQQELSENPALDEIDSYEQTCARCGSLIFEGICGHCASADMAGDAAPAQREEAIDPLLFVAAPRSLSEVLLSDLYATLPASEHPIALALVGNLDDHGFLSYEPAAIAAQLNLDLDRVHAVLQRLCELGPPGIATRNTQECLLAQIDALAARGTSCPYARDIIEHHFADLGAGRFKQIARQLRISAEQIEAARNFIRRYLWPYPAQAAHANAAPTQRPRYRTADISITYRDETFLVEVLHSPRRLLRLNPIYQDLSRRAASLSEEERAHVHEYIARARTFLTNLRQREATLLRIGEAIVARQQPFLLHGIRYLAPMTRSEIALDIGVHESTVSRATADKSALLPNGTLLPISELFVAARGVQDVLRELIAEETSPLSDDALAQRLGALGYPIARRTVAKYRDILKIAPSHLR